MKLNPYRKPKNKGDKYALMREANAGTLPPLYENKIGTKYADPEDVIQHEVNKILKIMGQFQFRIPASVYSAANDKSITGWPDSPMITRLQDGLALMGPLELKRRGKTMSDAQVKMQGVIGTVEADNFEYAYEYIKWYRIAYDHIKNLLQKFPLPSLPLYIHLNKELK